MGSYRSPVIGFSVVVLWRSNGAREYCVKLHRNGSESWSSEWIKGHPRDQDVIPLVLTTLALTRDTPVDTMFGIPPKNKI